MDVSWFDYHLPEERIAQAPARPRESARLFVHHLGRGTSEHLHVADLPDCLDPRDLLVVNDTRVRAARLVGRRPSGGAVELLLLECRTDGTWRALVKPAARVRSGDRLVLEGGALEARMVARLPDASGSPGTDWTLELSAAQGEVEAALERVGRMPLPPYVRRAPADGPLRERDRQDYQTMFARALGAVAAPTAGLHFTPALTRRLGQRGVERTSVTLHVGEGTFRPVTSATVEGHVMHAERFELCEDTVQAVARCRRRSGRVVAVGTTSVRVLESCAGDGGELTAQQGSTQLFLVPGAAFRVVDALLTNFHLPRSTLLMLVSAFAGRERVLDLYAQALERGYRFCSYGDAMLFLP